MQRTPAKVARSILAKYKQGDQVKSIAAAVGCSIPTIYEVLRRSNAPVRKTVMTQKEKKEAIHLYVAGASAAETGSKLGRGTTTILGVLHRHGVKLRKPGLRGAKHKSWKGGRSVNRYGYVRVTVPDDHPFASMRGTSGALEHRLVMAETIGRPLEAHETVHHINGDRQDNRPENLQLRSSRHGNGVVHRCLDCGSHNIETSVITDEEEA